MMKDFYHESVCASVTVCVRREEIDKKHIKCGGSNIKVKTKHASTQTHIKRQEITCRCLMVKMTGSDR